MDEDIDIEDHDVLDNPVIKKMFPDLSVLKKEMAIYDETDINIKSDPDTMSLTSQRTPTESLHSGSTVTGDDCIINADALSVSEENAPIKNEEPIFTNKIILGSKPSQQSNMSGEYYEKHIKPFMTRIYLNDIGSFLSNSGKYCQTCKILFAEEEDLNTHSAVHHRRQSSPKLLVHKPSDICKCKKCREYSIKSNNLLGYINKMRCKISSKESEKYKVKLGYYKNVSRTLHLSQANGHNKSSDSKCFHCRRQFPNQQLLIEHIYNVLQSNKTRVSHLKRLNKRKSIPMSKFVTQKRFLQNKGKELRSLKTKTNSAVKNVVLNPSQTHEPEGNTKNNMQLYRCYYCSFYFKNVRQYTNHLNNKHKETNILSDKLHTFDPECKYCFLVSQDVYSYNIHLQESHKDIIDKTIKLTPVIRIPKVEYVLAIKKGMETNSKQKILHKNASDMQSSEKSAEIQSSEKSEEVIENTATERAQTPSVSSRSTDDSTFLSTETTPGISYDSNNKNIPLVLQSVLFKCQRCDIYFMTAKSAMNHSEHMELLINWKCSNCQRIFKKCDDKYHILQHNYTNEFTVYELNEPELSRVLYNCSKCGVNFGHDNFAYHYKMCDDAPECAYCIKCDFLIDKRIKQHHDTEHIISKSSVVSFTIVDSDPIIIDCNENKIVKINSKIQKESIKMGYCESCRGFVDRSLFTCHKEEYCRNTTKRVCKYCGLLLTIESIKVHRRRHADDKISKLQDFVFYDLKTGKQILPPIPKYPKCLQCNVHFLTKLTRSKHTCEVKDFLTCQICDMKFSDVAFKRHIAFHHYKKHGQHKQNRSIIVHNDIEPTKPPPINNSLQSISCNTVSASKDHLTVDDTLVSNFNPSINKNISNQIESSITGHKIKKCDQKITHDTENKSAYVKVTQSDLELYSVVYCCAKCYITVDTYDIAVEHCQEHFNDINFSLFSDSCSVCKMKYDRRHYGDHKILHNLRLKNKSFSLITFDPFYFAHNYNIWIKNTFDSIDPTLVQLILDRSIYKYEGRIKLHVIQKGSCNITVYRCNNCQVYLEPETMYKHGENSCFRLRKHPCSFCGLPFISHISRMNHESVHKNSPDMSNNLFRIVIFNRDKDKQFNKNIINSFEKFILFMCRKCRGIFDRFQDRYHICNTLDLKKCSTCALNVFSADYKTHVAKHKYIKNFIYANMRIICFGQRKKQKPSTGLPAKFDGTLTDYVFYVCGHCNVCFKKSNQTLMINHDCTDTNFKVKCDECLLFFLKRQMNNHKKQHENDPYFRPENFSLIPYKEKDTDTRPGSEFRDNTDTSNINKKILSNDNNSRKTMYDEPADKMSSNGNDSRKIIDESSDKVSSLKNNNDVDTGFVGIITQHVNKLYKCSCGLHFLNSDSIKSHFGHCTLKIAKQNCSKCGLLFTPKELFNHLLKHHGDKKNKYNLIIINMTKDRSNIFNMYKCSKCTVHFVNLEEAKIHYINCNNTNIEKSECEKCNLFVDNSSFDIHIGSHHEDDVADIEVVDVGKVDECAKYKSMGDALKNLTAEADAVITSDYNISLENLAKIDLKFYSNTVYKCQKCNIHFLVDSTFRRHIERHQPFSSTRSDCNFCGLSFSLQSLRKHIYIHHEKMKLDLNNLIIKCEIDS